MKKETQNTTASRFVGRKLLMVLIGVGAIVASFLGSSMKLQADLREQEAHMKAQRLYLDQSDKGITVVELEPLVFPEPTTQMKFLQILGFALFLIYTVGMMFLRDCRSLMFYFLWFVWFIPVMFGGLTD